VKYERFEDLPVWKDAIELAVLITFLYIARGSAGEVRSMSLLLHRMPRFSNLKSQISNLRFRADSISRQVRAWADSLQNSDIKGQRYLNEKTRRENERQKEREEAQDEWRQRRDELTARLEARQKQSEAEQKQSIKSA
jgi:hypothetical protein